MKRSNSILITICCLCAAVVIGMFFAFGGSGGGGGAAGGNAGSTSQGQDFEVYDPFSEEEADVIAEEYSSITEELQAVSSNYLNDDGYVNPDKVSALLDEAEAALSKDNSGRVDSFSRENDCILIVLSSGMNCVYTPPLEGVLSGSSGNTEFDDGKLTIIEYEPYYHTDTQNPSSDLFGLTFYAGREAFLDYLNLKMKPGFYEIAGRGLQDSVARYLVENGYCNPVIANFKDDKVDLESFNKLGQNQLILWEGHGNYTPQTHSILWLGTGPTDAEYEANSERERIVDLKEDLAELLHTKLNKDDVRFVRVVFQISPSDNPKKNRIGVTPAFFETYIKNGQLKGSAFYAFACYSLADDMLADVICNMKGADVYIGNTNETVIVYAAKMRDKIFTYLAEGSTLEEALQKAKDEVGQTDNDPGLFGLRFKSEEGTAEVAYYPKNAGNWKLIQSTAETKGSADNQTKEKGSEEEPVVTTLPDSAQPSDVSMSLVFDVSGSMDEKAGSGNTTKMSSAKKQGTAFINSIKSATNGGAADSTVKVGVVSFSDNATNQCDLTNDSTLIINSIDGLKPTGSTNMYEGLEYGLTQVANASGEKIVIFLSDGLNNVGYSKDDIRALADQAASEHIKVYTIGFGPQSSIDEDLLKYIATTTGGAYAHEDSSDANSAAVGIFRVMKMAELQGSGLTVVGETTGTVSQGQTVQGNPVEVPANGTLTTYLYWPGSLLTLQFTDPEGTVVTSNYPGYTVDDSTIPTQIQISNAMPGTWQMSVTGEEVSMQNEPFFAVSAFEQTAAAPVSGGGGGGGSADGGMIMLFVFAAVAIGALLFVYAFSKRRAN